MPRRKRNFIQRSRATTYQLVHAPTAENPQHHVFVPSSLQPGEAVPTDADNAPSGAGAAPDAEDLQGSYKPLDYELGEFGFPDDGYNYAKHFRPIGGGGGVFMDALSGLPDPDAVRSGSSAQKFDAPVPPRSAAVTLREEVEKADEAKRAAGPSQRRASVAQDGQAVDAELDEDAVPTWRDPRDEVHRAKAIQEIHRDRKRNADLAAVMDALDSDAELDDDALSAIIGEDLLTEPEQLIKLTEQTKEPAYSSDGFELEDDFVQRAAISDKEGDDPGEKSKHGDRGLDGVVENFREPRVLDEQFERFMQGYDLDVSTDEEVVEYRSNMREMAEEEEKEAVDIDEVRAFLTKEELAAMGGDTDEAALTSGLKGLNLFNDEAGREGDGAPDEEDEVEDEDDLSRPFEANGAAGPVVAAEFENGMERLLLSYERVKADEALTGQEGLAGARSALERQMEADAARAARKAAAAEGDEGAESDDSELEAHFEELYKDDGEQWDCETILTTYTNMDNHPSVIDDAAPARRRRPQRDAASSVIKLDPRTQAPAEAIGEASAASAARDDFDYGSRRPTAVPGGAAREKKETKEEKKARKTAVKEAARERRALKSEMKKAFGSEHVKQGRHAASLGKSKVATQF